METLCKNCEKCQIHTYNRKIKGKNESYYVNFLYCKGNEDIINKYTWKYSRNQRLIITVLKKGHWSENKQRTRYLGSFLTNTRSKRCIRVNSRKMDFSLKNLMIVDKEDMPKYINRTLTPEVKKRRESEYIPKKHRMCENCDKCKTYKYKEWNMFNDEFVFTEFVYCDKIKDLIEACDWKLNSDTGFIEKFPPYEVRSQGKLKGKGLNQIFSNEGKRFVFQVDKDNDFTLRNLNYVNRSTFKDKCLTPEEIMESL